MFEAVLLLCWGAMFVLPMLLLEKLGASQRIATYVPMALLVLATWPLAWLSDHQETAMDWFGAATITETANAQASLSDARHAIKGTNIACTDLGMRERIGELAASGDREGAQDYAHRAVIGGDCMIFHDGDLVYLDAAEDGRAKVHLSGDVDHSWWLLSDKVR